MNFFKKLLFFTLISVSQAYGMESKQPALCQGFVTALSQELQQEYSKSNKNWPACSNAACYTYKDHNFCPMCLLNTYAAAIFTPLIDDTVLNKTDADMLTLSTGTNVYNPAALTPEDIVIITQKAQEFCAADKDIQPFVDHHGVPGCTGFETMATSETKEDTKHLVCSEIVPDNCVHCYEALVKKHTGTKIPYMVILPSTQTVKSGNCQETGVFFGIARKTYRLGLKDEKTTAKHFSSLPQGRTVQCLVIAGDHGLCGTLFGKGEKFWREQVVQPLVQAGFKAEKIILDACHTGSMVHCFKDLLTDNGQIIAGVLSVHNIWMAQATMSLAVDEKTGVEKTEIKDAEHASRTIKSTLKNHTKHITRSFLSFVLAHSTVAFHELCLQLKNVLPIDERLGALLTEWLHIIAILEAWKKVVLSPDNDIRESAESIDNIKKVIVLIDNLLNERFFSKCDNPGIKAQLKKFKELEEGATHIPSLRKIMPNYMQKVEHVLRADMLKTLSSYNFDDPSYTGLFSNHRVRIEGIKQHVIDNGDLDNLNGKLAKILSGAYGNTDAKDGIFVKLAKRDDLFLPCQYCIYCKRDDTMYYDAAWESAFADALQFSDKGLYSPTDEHRATLRYIKERGIRTVAAHDFCRFQELN